MFTTRNGFIAIASLMEHRLNTSKRTIAFATFFINYPYLFHLYKSFNIRQISMFTSLNEEMNYSGQNMVKNLFKIRSIHNYMLKIIRENDPIQSS